MPPMATYHGPGLTRRAPSQERIHIPTFNLGNAQQVSLNGPVISHSSYFDMKGMQDGLEYGDLVSIALIN